MFQRILIDPIWTTEPRGFSRRMLRHQIVALPLMLLSVTLFKQSADQRFVADAHADSAVVTEVASGDNGDRIVAAAPSGWRRTSQGWQHVSQWYDTPSMTMRQRLERDRQRQSSGESFGNLLSDLGRIAPWKVAVLQILSIAGIFLIAHRLRGDRARRLAGQHSADQ